MFLYTNKKISPEGRVNEKDLKKIARDTLIFFAAPLLMYLGQLSGTLSQNGFLTGTDLLPTLITIGAIQTWLLGIGINFLLKLQDGRK